MTDEERDPLDLLAEEFTTALRRGERPDIDAWAERHPDHAADIREIFPAIVAMEGVKESTRGSRPAVALPGTIERLGDFRILGEIGRGGMGVVYEAEQESLGRRVALKVLPALRDPRRQRRFERETRLAARLHHTNIVPIYGVGEAEGFSYYVMPVIRGVGLDIVIDAMRGDDRARERPGSSGMTPADAVRGLRTGWFRPAAPSESSVDSASSHAGAPNERAHEPSPPPDPGPPLDSRARYWRSVADIGRQVADALAHAHHIGVLHRDVKPANLLLDAQGIVWVTDFGLAKAAEPGAGLTHSGDLVGTLQYMSPEQLRGEYDERSDLHALGLTLFELLTLTPAYAGSDRGTLLQRVAESSPPRPSSLRAGIPRDLETIVLKAIQPEPTHRYRSADELRDDLEAFLEDRPIRARRATVFEHGWRWCRRNKLVASLAAVTLLTIVGAAISGWTAWAKTSLALKREADAADRAEANLALARKGFEGVFDRIAGPDRLELVVDDTDEDAVVDVQRPEVSEADAALLEELLGFYDRFAASNEGDAGLRLDTAKAYRRVGDIQLQLWRVSAAEEAYRRALATFEDLDGGTGAQATNIGAVLNDLGRALQRSRERDEAVDAHRRALGLLQSSEASVQASFELARTHDLLADASRWREPPDEAIEHRRRAHELYGKLAAQQPDNVTAQLGSIETGMELATSFAWAGDAQQARRLFEENFERLETLADRHEDVSAYQRELLDVCRRILTYHLRPRGRRDDRSSRTLLSESDAERLADTAVRVGTRIHAESPDSDDAQRGLADGLRLRAEVLLSQGAEDAAPERLRAARADLARAVDLDDRNFRSHALFADVLEALGEDQRELVERERLIERLRQRVSAQGELRRWRGPLLRFVRDEYQEYARALRDAGEAERAESVEQEAKAFPESRERRDR